MLTERLNCIIGYVNSEISADIGTDHAYAATELIRQGRAKKVIAADVREGPLNAARDNIKKHNMEAQIETRLGSGLSVLKPYEADTAIIAGMGGELICQIIKDDIDTARTMKLILQPMNSQYETRRFLLENGFRIVCEDIVCEGNRVYNVLIAEDGHMTPFKTDIEFHVPGYLKEHPLFEKLFNKKKREFVKIINGLEKAEICDSEKLVYYRKSLKELEEIKNGKG